MNPGFQEGRRPRANALASLANTGHVSPLARRPSAGAVAHANKPAPAHRPGPRPMSARQTMALNAQNARVRREVEQTIAECRREIHRSNSQMQRRGASLAFSQIDFDKRAAGRDAVTEVVQVPGTYRQMDVTRYAAGGLWVYVTTLHDGWGDHQYFVFNPDTGALLQFTPESAISDPKRHLYASKRAQIQGTAAGTGVVGGYLEKGFLGTSALFLTGGMAAELGAYAFVTEEVAPVVSRIAVQAYRVARPAVEAYAKRAAKGALMRMSVDISFQFGTSYLTADPSKGARSAQALQSINGTQVLGAGAIVGGENARAGAKFLVALGTAVTTNLVTVSGSNAQKYKSYWHMVNFQDSQQGLEYVRNVIIGTLADPLKEMGAGTIAKQAAGRAEEWAAQASGKASRAVLKLVTETRVELPATIVLGSLVEIPKKLWEQHHDKELEERAKQEKAEAKRHPVAHPLKASPTRK